MDRLLAALHKSDDFREYLELETVLWRQHEEALTAIDLDPSFRTDEDEPAVWKRDAEKYRIDQEFRGLIDRYRKHLIDTITGIDAQRHVGSNA